MARRHQQPRRGVVLLVVLTLLTLLIVVGLTFAIISGQYRRAAEAAARQNRYGDPPDRLLERGMLQLVRDTNDARSVLRTHSLLRDVFGESIRGFQVDNATFTAGGQFLEFTASLADESWVALPLNSYGNGLRTRGFLSGCVLTFVTGKLQNVSTRVVDYEVNVGGAAPQVAFRLLLPKLDGPLVDVSEVGDRFLVNGRPFVGTGAGFNAASGELNRLDNIGGFSAPQALLPNRSGMAAATDAQYMEGGLNECYDAADYQNLFLAARIRDPNNPSRWQVLPSFHRTALINYWVNHSSGIWTDAANGAAFRRRVVLRPMHWDHPNFDGGNTVFAEAVRQSQNTGSEQPITDWLIGRFPNPGQFNNAWDVDCDGDGQPDAIWLDLGFPIQTDPSGRRYKPLFAILCEDLDGKLNLNAHASLSHVDWLAGVGETQPMTLPATSTIDTISTALLPRGQGYGPPEIGLQSLFPTVVEYRQLLQGYNHPILGPIPGRYGLNALPGDDAIQPLALLKLSDYPQAMPPNSVTNYFLPATPLSSFSSPYDLRGELAFGLDYRGMPLYERPTRQNVLINSAYELDLSLDAPRGTLQPLTQTTVDDAPFSLAELERLLRYNDVDGQSLPDRLMHLVSTFRDFPVTRRAVTTDSYDPPVPSILPWRELRTEFASVGMDRPRHVLDLIKMKIMRARSLNMASLDDPAIVNQLNGLLATLVAPEMMRGLRFDLNRPFGNGRDDNGNAVVDEHGVASIAPFRGEEALPETIWDTVFGPVPFDHDNDGVVGPADPDAFLARQQYARFLYVLMMAIKPAAWRIDTDGDPSNDALETAYLIAQWAVNVVDFRDADSIMTPFEFAIDPFTNGWNVDGILGTADDTSANRGLVWGCERPELLITEAIALHDRRTEDLTTPGGRVTGGENPDPHFDQRLRPRGSFFVELYNPWAGDDRAPGEFYYNRASNSWSPGVRLNQVASDGSPVWRMIVAKGPSRDRDPDHWDPSQRLPITAVERSVYFTPGPGVVEAAETPFYTDLPVAPVLPGRYALVGSAGQSLNHSGDPIVNDGGNSGIRDYVTTIGRRRDAVEDGSGGLNYLQTRRIVLEPSLNPDNHQAWVLGNNHPNPALAEPIPPNIQSAVAVVINLPRSLSVTEPVTGYPDVGPSGEVWDPSLADYEGAYFPPIDEPLDAGINELESDGTVNDYCMVHLQRLANPLLPYHPVVNPYRTIDSMSSDLVAFNGVTTDTDPNAGDNEPRFTTRERGRSLAAAERRWLWKHERGPLEGGPPSPDSERESVQNHVIDHALGHTLGYLNRDYHPYYTAATAPAAFYIGAPQLVDNTTPPFPWLTWSNRPFVAPHELMQVPITRSSRLPYDFALTPTGSPYAPGMPYRFGHLLNFFQSSAESTTGSNFYRLFELAQVPSRFVNTETYLNPDFFTGTGFHPATRTLQPPFNRISHYRDPGRVNANTVFLREVWDGVLAGHDELNWQKLITSRRGFGPSGAALNFLQPDPEIPTFFGNPFRAPGAAHLVPPTAIPNRLNRLEVEATLLRSDAIGYEPSPVRPLLENSSNQWHRNTELNPYFRFQDLSRLGNLVTTRSNVFAVWITMGFFEVEVAPAGVSEVHPDGFRLGRELGEDSGTIKRHRAFYIIDRSIPVAFEPGENHNVDHAVRLRRFIE